MDYRYPKIAGLNSGLMNIPKKNVFLVGLYYGTEKPHDSNDFVSDFVQDANNLITNGVILNKTNVEVSIK